MAVLVTGGAGYIGSHTCYALADRGEQSVALDNLSSGAHVPKSGGISFVQGDVGDTQLIRDIIKAHHITSVIHFAGSTVVSDSVMSPLKFYANNTGASRSLIEACLAERVNHFIFSSTAAIYGSPAQDLVDEDAPSLPINPYGRSKLMTEWMLEDVSRASPDFHHVSLRYFNVAGADPQERTGQSTPHATHLIKRACQVALGRLPHLEIYGTDYPTPDGTGVRDFIHVTDVANAHLCVLDALRAGSASTRYNCGYGTGTSVREVIAHVEAAAGCKLAITTSSRRVGDPARVVSNPTRLKTETGWRPKYNDLSGIVASAYAWEKRLNGLSTDQR